MKPISPSWVGFSFLLDLSKKILNFIVCDQLKEPAEGGNLFFASKHFGSNFSQN